MSAELKYFNSTILAGIAIGIGGFAFLAQGGVIGAILFAFGLLTIIHYRWTLFTGQVGFVDSSDWRYPLLTLIGNLIGCCLVSVMVNQSLMDLNDTAQTIITTRLTNNIFSNGMLAIGCGFVMTTSVEFARQEKFLPLLFGVPLFIICGFPHCVADAFYLCCVPSSFFHEHFSEIWKFYLSIVCGNIIGCNLYRILNYK